MSHNTQKNIFITFLITFAFLIGFFIGNKEKVFADEYFSLPENTSISSEDFDLFWKALLLLDKKHPNANTISSKDRVWSAIQGLTASYDDPYTSFFNPKEMEVFEESISGEFSGVGMEVGLRNGFITVIAPIKNSPAEKIGVVTGDVITEINGENTLEMTIDEAVQKIRGPKGESVEIVIAREGEKQLLTFTIIRDIIELVSIETSIPENSKDVFVISLYSFTDDISAKFNLAMQEFIKSGKNKLVLDLRNNPGGYLSASIDIASVFIPQGKPVLIEAFSEDSGREDIIYRSKGSSIKLPKDFKMVVLVDQGSASASEIVAGALGEYDIATIVGAKTFGKGSVQEYLKLDDSTALKVTIATWLTPLGNSINKNGLVPDHEVKYDSESKKDLQLEKAIEILK